MVSKYKLSMFTTYTVNEIILYNSLQGLESVKCVNSGTDVEKWLNNEKCYEANDNKIFKWLVNNNYLVEDDTDEKAQRNAKIANLLEDNTLHLTIHLTECCNFRCEYCNVWENGGNISNETEKSIVQFIRHNIYKYKGVYIDWFGGEPLLKIDTIVRMSKSIIDICKAAKKPYCAGITTNGYLLTLENVQKLIGCRVVDICVTIDGNKDIHNSMRKLVSGEGTYDVIINNLMGIKKKIQNRFLEVTIRVNLTKDIVDSFDIFYNELDEKFGNDIRFSVFIKKVNDWGAEGVDNIRDKLICYTDIVDVFEKIKRNPKKLSIKENFSELEFGGRCCTASRRNNYTIYTNGMVGRCENPTNGMTIGHINDVSTWLTDYVNYPKWCGQAYNMPNRCDDCLMSPLCFSQECPKLVIEKEKQDCILTDTYIKRMLELFVVLNEERSINIE